MPKPTVLIAIETDLKTEAKDFGRRFIGALCDEDARLVPEHVSTSERFKDPFIDQEAFVQNWWAMPIKIGIEGEGFREAFWGPLWRRRTSMASRGKISHGSVNIKGEKDPSDFSFECRWAPDIDFSHLFDVWVDLASPDIAMLHVFTDAEAPEHPTQAQDDFQLGLFGWRSTSVPNMGWAMAFGPRYSVAIDAERIRAAGFSAVEHNGVLVVRVTDHLSDVVEKFELFSRRRAELKALFRPGFFLIADEPTSRAR